VKKDPEVDSRSGRQFAALPFMQRERQTVVMLVTSRETGRWVLPKGWAEKGSTGPELAAKEAFEEAGILGEVAAEPVGTYGYTKRLTGAREVTCEVEVFPLRVDCLLDDWPERTQRKREWFTPAQAAMAVAEGDLATLLLRLALPE